MELTDDQMRAVLHEQPARLKRFAVIAPILRTTVSYLRPTPIARIVARGEVLRFSSSSVVMQGALRDSDDIALAVATAIAVPRPFPA